MLERSPSPNILYYIHFILILTYNLFVYTGESNLVRLGKIKVLPKIKLDHNSASECSSDWPSNQKF